MRVACLGGGPAGLYFAILMKLRAPACEVHVFERNRAGDTFGWGVVFSDQTLGNLQAADPVSERTIAGSFAHWDDIEVTVEGRTISSGGHGFIGIGRRHLLQILQARAAELGVRLHFEQESSADLSQYADFDLIVAADGVNSAFRTAHQGRFRPQIEQRRNKFIWLGTHRLFDAFSFIFERTHAGWIWAHAYRFSEDTSTFIVECSALTWAGLGFDGMDRDACIANLERIFADHLDGEGLMSNAAHLQGPEAWISFNRVHCERWSFDNVVLLGDNRDAVTWEGNSGHYGHSQDPENSHWDPGYESVELDFLMAASFEAPGRLDNRDDPKVAALFDRPPLGLDAAEPEVMEDHAFVDEE